MFAFAALLLASCANTSRVLQPDDRLLYRNRYDVSMADGSEVLPEVSHALSDINKYVRQQPKNGFLNIHHSVVNTYYAVRLSDSSWWARTMRSLGTAPVIYRESHAEASVRQILSLLEGRGCFGSSVSIDTQQISHQRVVVNYHIKATPRYVIDEIVYNVPDTTIAPLVERWRDASVLHVGDYYDQANLVKERERIARRLQYNGFYLASPDYIHFNIDTTYASKRLGIELVIDNPRVASSGQPSSVRPYQRYTIDTIRIDSTSVRQSTVGRVLTIMPGQLYAPFRTTSSYNALLNLRNFSLINIEYSESPRSTDSVRLLDTRIRLHPSMQQRVSASLEISNASPVSRQSANSGNFGAETVLQYQHKNLFGGAELLSIEGNFLVELNKSVFSKGFASEDRFSAFETGLNLSLDIPQFFMPMADRLVRGNAVPHTLISLGVDRQNRTYFERRQVNSSFAYTWAASRQVQHKLTPIEVSFVRFLHFSDEFIRRIYNLLDQRLMYQYSDHLIIDARYEYTYSNQFIGRKTNFSYFNTSLEVAGNLASLISTSTSLGKYDAEYDEHTLFGVSYSQYLRFSSEFKRYFYHGQDNTLVGRVLLGIGVPYGNSYTMPYEKSFFGGGPNNIRAWQIRYLGPGHFNSHESNYIYDRTGDITLVFNVEERFPIFGPFEGAIFADMGNVWLFREDDFLPGGNFTFSHLLSDMALGVGLGLRLKISILTLRLDMALPAYDPTYSYSQRWRIAHWKLNTINTNFGIDYPF